MIIWRLWVQSLVAFNFCALNQPTESAQVHAKWISARTPQGVRAESVDCAQSTWTGCGLRRTPHSPHRTGLDLWESVNYCHIHTLRLSDGCDSWFRLIILRPRKINDARGGQSTHAGTTEQQLGGVVMVVVVIYVQDQVFDVNSMVMSVS